MGHGDKGVGPGGEKGPPGAIEMGSSYLVTGSQESGSSLPQVSMTKGQSATNEDLPVGPSTDDGSLADAIVGEAEKDCESEVKKADCKQEDGCQWIAEDKVCEILDQAAVVVSGDDAGDVVGEKGVDPPNAAWMTEKPKG